MLKTLSCLVGMERALASSNLVFTVAVDKFGGGFLFLFLFFFFFASVASRKENEPSVHLKK